jgi:hypothetical protein
VKKQKMIKKVKEKKMNGGRIDLSKWMKIETSV